MNINHDTVFGWLMLAPFFYKANQNKKSLIVLSHALSKCTLDKVSQKQGVVRWLKFVQADNVCFENSPIIPVDLLIEANTFVITPVVYACFLSFLCHYHLKNVQECRISLRNLQLITFIEYFMGKDATLKSSSFYCLGTALQLKRDIESANQAFNETVDLLNQYPYLIRAMKRLSKIASV
ncbi:unnamed protein product [Mytilus coruscus]|uniref:Tetratricopeptide repeat protein n=1 Tax=Mytilus coruscus TaxID=42192 RepID=A0A6J8AA55_MYTCO|nr:unnamed protein product [Mytilus coruscus]